MRNSDGCLFAVWFRSNYSIRCLHQQVLMRALRDFNIPKIVSDDYPVFMGLIGDLFPALDVPRKRDLDFEKQIKQAVLDLHLQAEDSFVLKVFVYLHFCPELKFLIFLFSR